MNTEVKTYCYTCDGDTYHAVLYCWEEKEEDQNELYSNYMVLKCGGCRAISFLLRSENPNGLSGQEDEFFDVNYSANIDYDENEFKFLRERDYEQIPSKIRKIYDEVEIT